MDRVHPLPRCWRSPKPCTPRCGAPTSWAASARRPCAPVLPRSMPSCPAAAGRARCSPSCCCRTPAWARCGCWRRRWPASPRPSRPRRRSVMLFDPPAPLCALALAQLGVDAQALIVIHGRDGAHGARHLLASADLLWALEQALKSGQVGAVLAWLPARLRADALRRLQLAAQSHDGPVFLLRDIEARPAQPRAAAPGAAQRRHRRVVGARAQAPRPGADAAAAPGAAAGAGTGAARARRGRALCCRRRRAPRRGSARRGQPAAAAAPLSLAAADPAARKA